MATPTQNFVGTTEYTPTYYLHEGTKWGGRYGTGVVLDYSFPSGADTTWRANYGHHNEPSNSFSFTEAERDAARRALGAWDAVANVDFVENVDTATRVGELRFTMSTTGSGSGHAYQPVNAPEAGDVWMRYSKWHEEGHYNAIQPGTFEYHALLHEIGHALGLDHTFEGTYRVPKSHDTIGLSVMSYSGLTPGSNSLGASHYPTTPMYYDLVAIQRMYGREAHNTGNNNYVFNGNTKYWLTLDDSGGNDVISYNASTGAIINLNIGQWSTLGPAITFGTKSQGATVCIGPDTWIENAFGGNGNDTLIGNSLGNILDGRAGNDVIRGNAGEDLIRGNVGTDYLYGGAHKDWFDFNRWNDSIAGNARDRIFDFSRAQGDKIDLRDIDANFNAAGNQLFLFIGAQGFHKRAGELRTSGALTQGDVNGDGRADFELQVNVALIKSDFFL